MDQNEIIKLIIDLQTSTNSKQSVKKLKETQLIIDKLIASVNVIPRNFKNSQKLGEFLGKALGGEGTKLEDLAKSQSRDLKAAKALELEVLSSTQQMTKNNLTLEKLTKQREALLLRSARAYNNLMGGINRLGLPADADSKQIKGFATNPLIKQPLNAYTKAQEDIAKTENLIKLAKEEERVKKRIVDNLIKSQTLDNQRLASADRLNKISQIDLQISQRKALLANYSKRPDEQGVNEAVRLRSEIEKLVAEKNKIQQQDREAVRNAQKLKDIEEKKVRDAQKNFERSEAQRIAISRYGKDLKANPEDKQREIALVTQKINMKNIELEALRKKGVSENTVEYKKQVDMLIQLQNEKRKLTREAQEQAKDSKRISDIDSKRIGLLRQLVVQKRAGNTFQAQGLAVRVQELNVEKALISSGNTRSRQVKDQVRKLAEMRKELEKMRLETPRDVQNINAGSLFRIQANLLLNYAIMNQLRGAFQFGKQYIIEFETSLKNVQAVAAATTAETEGLSNAILESSKITKFSAIEIGNAALIMAQAGLSMTQIQGSLESVVMLATATGSDIKTAIDVATTSMVVFKRGTDEMTKTADILTQSLNLSKLNIEKIALSMQYAGNIAAQNNESLEDFLATMAAIANSGIRSGSTMATGYRQLSVSLKKPTDKLKKELKSVGLTMEDVNIEARGFINVMDTLVSAGFTAQQAFKSMELRGANIYSAIANNIEVARTFQTALTGMGSAARANEIQMNSLDGRMKVFSNTLGQLLIEATKPLVSAFKTLLDSLSSVMELLIKLPNFTLTLASAFGVLIASLLTVRLGSGLIWLLGLGPALKAVGGGVGVLKKGLAGLSLMFGGTATKAVAFSFSLKSLVGVLTALKTASLTMLATPLGATFAAIGTGVLLFNLFSGSAEKATKKIEELETASKELKGEFDSIKEKSDNFRSEISKLMTRYSELSGDSRKLSTVVQQLTNRYGFFQIEMKGTVMTVEDVIEALDKLAEAQDRLAKGKLGEAFDKEAESYEIRMKRIRELVSAPIRDVFFKNFTYKTTEKGLTNLPSESAEAIQTILKNFSTAESFKNLKTEDVEFLSIAFAKGISGAEKRIVELTELMSKRGFFADTFDSDNLEKEKNVLKEVISQLQISRNAATVTSPQFRASTLNEEVRASVLFRETRDEFQRLSAESSKVLSEFKGEKGLNLSPKTMWALADELSKIADAIENGLENALDINNQNVKDFVQGIMDRNPGSSKEQILRSLEGAFIDTKVQEIISTATTKADEKKVEAIQKTTGTFGNQAKILGLQLTQLDNDLKRINDKLAIEIKAIDTKLAQAGNRFSPLYGLLTTKQKDDLEREKFELENEQLERQLKLYDEQIPKLEQSYMLQLKLREQSEAAVELMERSKAEARSRDPNDEEGLGPEAMEGEKEALRQLEDSSKKTEETVQKLNEAKMKQIELARTLKIINGEEALSLTTYREEAQNGLDNYIREANARSNIMATLGTDLHNVFTNAENAFSSFMQATTDGSTRIKDAFNDMAISILKSIQKIAMDKMAAGLFSMFAGAVKGLIDPAAAAAGSAPTGGAISLPSLSFKPMKRGGPVGIANRDSVPILGEPGEFMLRKSAVDMIGIDNLNRINALGNKKISESSRNFSGGSASGSTSPVVTNVYVMSPEAQPQLTERDVIVALTDDMQRNGQSIKLIKQIITGRS